MAKSADFTKEIASLKAGLVKSESELEELLDQRQAYESDIDQLRSSLDSLKSVLNGELPNPTKRRGVKPVPRKEGSDRPKRGSRKAQIQTICRTLGRAGESFRTAQVLRELKRVEDEITDGIRSYTYAVMNTLEEEKFIEKVGRGTWKLL
jgi:hypothetical protein